MSSSSAEGQLRQVLGALQDRAWSDDHERVNSAAELMDALTSYLSDRGAVGASLAADLIDHGWATVLSLAGPGDENVAIDLVQLLGSLQRPDSWKVVLDWLPAAVPSDPSPSLTNDLLLALRCLLERDQTLLPVLTCLDRLPNQFDAETLTLALKALAMVDTSDLPTVVRVLLRHVATDSEAAKAVVAVRDELGEAGELRTSIVEAIWSGFDGAAVEKLARAYLKVLETADHGDYLWIDLWMLLYLWGDRGEECGRICDRWLATGQFPFDQLDCIAAKVFDEPSDCHDHLIDALIQLPIFLLLAPVRVNLSPACMTSMKAFALNVHDRLGPTQRRGYVQSLLRLAEETAPTKEPLSSARHSRKRKLSNLGAFQRPAIHMSVHNVLRSLAEQSPGSLVPFRHVLLRWLEDSLTDGCDDDAAVGLCRVVALVVDGTGDDARQTLALLEKMLSESQGVANSGKVAVLQRRGLVLARELIRSSSNSSSLSWGQDDLTRIKDLVLGVLLPSTRRMIEPEIGLPGLSFLVAWMELNPSASKEVFKHLKLLLSNTGLVQALDSYRATANSPSVLGYASKELSVVGSQAAGRDMVFCICYFLRRVDCEPPTRWDRIVRWVFDLVDAYLELGRQRASNGWLPDGWLRAPLELPLVRVHDSGSCDAAAIEDELNRFSFVDTRGEAHRESYGVEAEEKVSDEITGALEERILPLCVGITISAAVLKHSFQHCVESGNSGDRIDHRMVKCLEFQMKKMHDMRRKLHLVDRLMSRGRPGARLGCDQFHDFSRKSALDQLRNLETMLFHTAPFVCREVLWECLADSEDEKLIKRGLSDLQQDETAEAARGLEVIQMKRQIAEDLIDILRATDDLLKDRVHIRAGLLHTLRMCAFMVDCLPVLRKGFFAKRRAAESSLTLRSILFCADAYFRLLAAVTATSLRSPAFLSTCIEASSVVKMPAGGSPIDQMFNFTASMLLKADTPGVAGTLVEVLSMLAVNDTGDLLREAIKSSWHSLHTVYAQQTRELGAFEAPFIVRRRLSRHGSGTDGWILSTVKSVESIYTRLSNQVSRSSQAFGFSAVSLLRHWGLLVYSPDHCELCASHLGVLTKEFAQFMARLAADTGAPTASASSRLQTSEVEQSPVPFLSATTSDDVFRILVNMVVGALGVAEPCSPVISREDCSSPFTHIETLLRLFSQLVGTFESHFLAFFPQTVATLQNSCRVALGAVARQMNGCIHWRSVQPVLTWKEKESGVFDPGDVVHLQHVLSLAIACTTSRITGLCDFLEKTPNQSQLSRRSKLRYATGKVEEKLRHLAIVHNLAISVDVVKQDSGHSVLPLKSPLPLPLGNKLNDETRLRSLAHHRDIVDDDSSRSSQEATFDDGSDGSFGVAGGWGGGDYDEDNSIASLQLK